MSPFEEILTSLWRQAKDHANKLKTTESLVSRRWIQESLSSFHQYSSVLDAIPLHSVPDTIKSTARNITLGVARIDDTLLTELERMLLWEELFYEPTCDDASFANLLSTLFPSQPEADNHPQPTVFEFRLLAFYFHRIKQTLSDNLTIKIIEAAYTNRQHDWELVLSQIVKLTEGDGIASDRQFNVICNLIHGGSELDIEEQEIWRPIETLLRESFATTAP